MTSPKTIALLVFIMVLALPVRADAEPDTAPLMAEELLEMVLSKCRAGQSAEARRLAQDIQAQLPTTAAIDALLAPVLDGACAPTASSGLRELHLSMGWDDNVNLGLFASTVSFSSPGQAFTFQLDDSYKPVPSAYLGATGLHEVRVDGGWIVQTQVGARQVVDYSPLDTLGLQVTGRRDWSLLGLPGLLTMGWTETWLGGRHFRSAPSVAWQSQSGTGERRGWGLDIGAQYHNFADNTFDARQLQLGVTYLGRPGARTQVNLSAGLMHDQALGSRAGGDRRGMNLLAGWQQAWLDGVWHVQWAHQQWMSAKDFLPGLIEYHRRNRITSLVMGYQYPMGPGGAAYVEYQHRNSQDNVPLYAYRSNQLSMGWVRHWH